MGSASGLVRRGAAVLGELGRRDPPLLAAQLAAAALLLAPVGLGLVRAAVLVLALLALLAPRIALSPWLWATLAGLTALRVVLDWPMSDNHAYLLFVWCTALAVSLGAQRPRGVLARNARLLIAAVFALATLQKAVLSPDFTDDTFFRWALAEDPRFEDLGALLGRGPADLERTRAWLEAAPGPPPEGAAFVETPALRRAAHLLTWATLLVEGAVALAFLAPRALVSRLRDPALLLFCGGTYALAPVAGFGWLLLSMGVAQCGREGARWLYLAVFGLLVFHREVSWLAFALPPG
jgi:hypothetical protein